MDEKTTRYGMIKRTFRWQAVTSYGKAFDSMNVIERAEVIEDNREAPIKVLRFLQFQKRPLS